MFLENEAGREKLGANAKGKAKGTFLFWGVQPGTAVLWFTRSMFGEESEEWNDVATGDGESALLSECDFVLSDLRQFHVQLRI